MRSIDNYESWAMQNAKKGTSIVSFKTTNLLTGSANHYERKIKTERIVTIEGTLTKPIVTAAVKITFLDNPNKKSNERS
jgi:hypothetical protein